jgi:hypothetical protein
MPVTLSVSFDALVDTIVSRFNARPGAPEVVHSISRLSWAEEQRQRGSILSEKYYSVFLSKPLKVLHGLGADVKQGIEKEFLWVLDEKWSETIAYHEMWRNVIDQLERTPQLVLISRTCFGIPKWPHFVNALFHTLPETRIVIAGVPVNRTFMIWLADSISMFICCIGTLVGLLGILAQHVSMLRRRPLRTADQSVRAWHSEGLAYYPGSGVNDPVLQYGGAMKSNSSRTLVFALGPGRRPKDSEVSLLGNNAVFVQPIAQVGWRFRGADMQSVLCSLVAGVYAMGKIQPGTYQIVAILRIATRLSRGFAHARWVETYIGALPEVVVFSRCLSVDAIILGECLRSARSINTVHYLHGIVEGVHPYVGPATMAFCRNVSDAEVIKRRGRYTTVAYAPPSGTLPTLLITANQHAALVITNILTSTDPGSPDRLGATSELLKISAEVFRARNVFENRITWRPHLYEISDWRGFKQAKAVASQLGIECNRTMDLHEQLVSHNVIICTWSGAISDALRAGRIPIVYFGFSGESGLVFDRIPDKLKFRCAKELFDAVAAIQTPKIAVNLYNRMIDVFNTQAPSIPAPGYFYDIIRRNVVVTDYTIEQI